MTWIEFLEVVRYILNFQVFNYKPPKHASDTKVLHASHEGLESDNQALTVHDNCQP